MKPSFTAHAKVPEKSHDKLFNFVTPAKRWAKKKTKPKVYVQGTKDTPKDPYPVEVEKVATFEEQDEVQPYPWQMGQQLSSWGYDPQVAKESDMMADPLWYRRRLAQLQQMGPEGAPVELSGLQGRNEALRNLIGNVGTSAEPDQISGLEAMGRAFAGGTSGAILRAREGGYDSAMRHVVSQIRKANPSIPESQAIRAAQRTLGRPEQFQEELGSKLIREGAPGPNLESLSPWFTGAGGAGILMRAAALPSSVTGRLWRYRLQGGPKTPEEQQDFEALNNAMEGATRANQLEAARKGESPLWAPLQMLSAAEGATLGFTQPGIDASRAKMQQALRTLMSGGTAQNQILMEEMERRNELQRDQRRRALGAAVPKQLLGTGDYERLAEQAVAKDNRARGTMVDPTTGARYDPSVRARAMTRNPYTNIATMDLGLGSMPFMGDITGLESAKAGRKWSPSQWSGMARDWLTGGDTSHQYLMNEPWLGKERTKGYQDVNRALDEGTWDYVNQPLAGTGVRVANPGQKAPWYHPASWIGANIGETAGRDPKALREDFERSIGGRLRRGEVSLGDVEKLKKNMQGEYGEAVGMKDYLKDYYKNLPLGMRRLEMMKNSADKVTPEDPEAEITPYTEEQASRAKWLTRKQMLPEYSYEKRISDPEATFGKGLYERTHFMGPGRHADNWMPLFRKIMTDQDLTHFDPYISEQREKILNKQWIPGMLLGPHAQKRRFGWQNPLGGLGRFLGTVEPQGKTIERLQEGAVSSPAFQALIKKYHEGLISPEQFQSDTGDLPSATSLLMQAQRLGRDPVEYAQEFEKANTMRRYNLTMARARDFNRILGQYSSPLLPTMSMKT